MSIKWLTEFKTSTISEESAPGTCVIFHKKVDASSHYIFTRNTTPNGCKSHKLPLPKKIQYAQSARWDSWVAKAFGTVVGRAGGGKKPSIVGKVLGAVGPYANPLLQGVAGLSLQTPAHYKLIWGGNDFLSMSLEYEWLLNNVAEMKKAMGFLRDAGACLAPTGLFDAKLTDEISEMPDATNAEFFKRTSENMKEFFNFYKPPASVVTLQVGSFIKANVFHLVGFSVEGGTPWVGEGEPGRLNFSMKVHLLDLPDSDMWKERKLI